MSPEYEGPQDEEEEGVAPRRVKHLIVLPGGAAPEGDASGADREADGEDEADGVEEARGQMWISQGGGASAVAAQMADAIPLEASPAQSLRLKLKVISRSVTSTKAPGMPFIIFASVLVGAAIFALVVLHVMVDQSSFRMDTLESQVTRQEAQLRELRYAVSVQEAPGRVANLASQAGLVPATNMQTLVGPAQTTPSATATASASGAMKTAARR
jgi:cell division protein FtsL